MTGFSPIAAAAIGSFEASLSAAASSESELFYEELRDGFAKDIVAQFNTGEVVLVKPSAVAGADPLNLFAAQGLRTARNAVVMGFATEEIKSGRVLFSDRRVLIDAADFTSANTPAGDDMVEIDGKLHTIESLQAVPAAGPVVIYIIQARTGGAR